MPELKEEMYCHQQICIPPAFPYLLRQYAKAAIRTQPVDLLKWSTAYWRCLSLNVPPPVKPRLEYPIPRDFYGVTPGWLKALNYQLLNCKTVPFRILWDRWMGACLQHKTLIQLLCLGGFTDDTAIPWNRFIALCAGTLTDNLTNTMVLICEILTEEPEGGSAQISVDTFLDLYKFLASIDASKPQTLLNLYFTDAVLGITPRRKKRKKRRAQVHVAEPVPSSTTTEEATVEEELQERDSIGEPSIVSCPDIASDDVYPESLEIPQEDDRYYYFVSKPSPPPHPTINQNHSKASIATVEFNPVTITRDDEHQSEGSDEGELSHLSYDPQNMEEAHEEEPPPPQQTENNEDEIVSQEHQASLPVEEDEKEMREPDEKRFKTMVLNEAVEKYLHATETVEGEYEMEVKPERVLPEVKEVEGEDDYGSVEGEGSPYEEVYVDAIPGIGPVVPDELVEAVVGYFRKVSAGEHGMAMPRHVRHYTCPPLEVIEIA